MTNYCVHKDTCRQWLSKGMCIGCTYIDIEKEYTLPQPVKIPQNCDNCYHRIDNYCACREPRDMVTEPNQCTDWYPRG